MVKIQEYKPDEYMVTVTKSEALQLIKSLVSQLSDDNCNRDRIEFGKRHGDDVEYFSIAVDESVTKFHIMTNIGGGNPTHDMTLNRFDTMEDAQGFMTVFRDQGTMLDYNLWIKEVQV